MIPPLHDSHRTKCLLKQAILTTLQNIALSINTHDQVPPPSSWPSTRQIAEAHNMSIYKARLLLLDMVNKGLVTVSDRAISNSLRWFPRIEGGDLMDTNVGKESGKIKEVAAHHNRMSHKSDNERTQPNDRRRSRAGDGSTGAVIVLCDTARGNVPPPRDTMIVHQGEPARTAVTLNLLDHTSTVSMGNEAPYRLYREADWTFRRNGNGEHSVCRTSSGTRKTQRRMNRRS
jgi:hypothetical protein